MPTGLNCWRVVSTPAPASRTKPDRLPSEFRTYWETLDRPSVRRLRAAFQLVLGFDLVPPDEQVLQYGHGHYDADPLAEEFVAQVYDRMGTKVGRGMLETALEHGIGAVDDPPKSLVRLMEDVDEEPSWLDWSLIDRGAAASGAHARKFKWLSRQEDSRPHQSTRSGFGRGINAQLTP